MKTTTLFCAALAAAFTFVSTAETVTVPAPGAKSGKAEKPRRDSAGFHARHLARIAAEGGFVSRPIKGSVVVIRLETGMPVAEGDSREVAELKRIVAGMKDEIHRYLANGIGTPQRYVRRLLERQVREAQIYNRAVADLKNEKNEEKRNRINASLRAIGLKTVPLGELTEE